MKVIKRLLKKIIPDVILDKIRHWDEYLRIISIQKALRCQGFFELYNKLESIVPDISNQYTSFRINTEYYKVKVRAEHAFQIHMVQKAFELLQFRDRTPFTVVDIGDSSGTHLQYLEHFYRGINTLSINIDNEAVKRIKEKGMNAICARAEELKAYSINTDVYLSFEMIEHLCNPVNFLYDLSHHTECKAFIITVPYVENSRVGLRHIRDNCKNNVFSENTHIFELSPSDWKLIFKHTGWFVIYEEIYLQYPKKGIFSLTKDYWKKIDYEGFYGALLSRDFSWSNLYKGW